MPVKDEPLFDPNGVAYGDPVLSSVSNPQMELDSIDAMRRKYAAAAIEQEYAPKASDAGLEKTTTVVTKPNYLLWAAIAVGGFFIVRRFLK